MANRIEGNVIITGDLQANSMSLPASCVSNSQVSSTAAISRSKLAQDNLKAYPVLLTDLRIHDAVHTVLTGTSGTDDLALVGNTTGTNAMYITTGDVGASTVTRYARFLTDLPAEYVDGETVTIRLWCGMQTAIADGTATVDIQAYAFDNDGTLTADLCSTAAQSINDTTAAHVDFQITPTNLVSGSILDVRVALAVADTATDVTIANIYAIALLCDVKG